MHPCKLHYDMYKEENTEASENLILLKFFNLI